MGLSTDIDKGVFDRFRSLPIWRPALLVGAMAGDAVRYTMASLVVIVLGIALGFRPDGGPAGVVASLILLLSSPSACPGSASCWRWSCGRRRW